VAETVRPLSATFARALDAYFRRDAGPAHPKETKKTALIEAERIRSVFMKNSHLCSLHIFDALHGIRTDRDFDMIFGQFLNDLLWFEELTSPVFFDFFIQFCESQCVNNPAHYFMKTLLKPTVITEEMTGDMRIGALICEFLANVFRTGLLAPSEFVGFLLNKKKNSGVHEPLLRLFFQLAADRPTDFSIESILTETVVKKLDGNPLFTELLIVLQGFPPPIINERIRAQIADEPGNPVGAAYFSLLPPELRADSFESVFSYFVENVGMTTATFWALWLKVKIFYHCTFPLTLGNPGKSESTDYLGQLSTAFSNLLLTPSDIDPEPTEILLSCWNVLCKSGMIPNTIVGRLSTELKNGKTAGFGPVIMDYLHPVLMSISEPLFEVLCDGFLKFPYPDTEFGEFVQVAVSVFVVFASRFSRNQAALRGIADQVLQWLTKIHHEGLESLTFCIDALNYIFAQTGSFPPDPDRGVDPVQAFHENLKHSLGSLPAGLRKFVIPNQPPAFFVPRSEPLFRGYPGPAPSYDPGPADTSIDPMMGDWDW
jgi:hypothetical protein